jgi:hypothetical protein
MRQKVEEMEGKIEEVKREGVRDREFYESALEERFNQLEALEVECEELRRNRASGSGKVEVAAIERERLEWVKKSE